MKRAVKAILRDKAGKVLVLRRSGTHPHIPYTPDIPGGTLEEGEDPLQALIREVQEETGVDISDMELTLLGKKKASSHGFEAEIELYEASGFDTRPPITLSFEHDEYEWVSIADLTHVGFFDLLVQEYVDAYKDNTKEK